MKKFIIISISLLSISCSSIQRSFIKLQLRERQLDSGQKIYFSSNVHPYINWQCDAVDSPKNYFDWDLMPYSLDYFIKGKEFIFINQLVEYIKYKKLDVNYVNAVIPINVSYGISEIEIDTVRVEFYKCQYINP